MFRRRFDIMLLKKTPIAYLGTLLAINQIFIMLAGMFETNTIFLFSIAALVIGIVIIEFDIKRGFLFYIASIILGMILIPNKVKIVSYIVFFGLYSIIKYIIEKYGYKKTINIVLEFILKIIFFNVVIIVGYYINTLFITFELKWWMFIVAQPLFIVYDYAYGLFCNYYIKSISPIIHRHLK